MYLCTYYDRITGKLWETVTDEPMYNFANLARLFNEHNIGMGGSINQGDEYGNYALAKLS